MKESKLPRHCIIGENLAFNLIKSSNIDVKYYKASLYFKNLLRYQECEYFEHPFNNKICGFTMKDSHGTSITINSNIDKSKYNFTFAHEIGHLLLHINNGYVPSIDTNDSLKNNIDKLEIEANQFAAHFLLPELSLVSQIRSGYTAFNIKYNSDVSLDVVKWNTINHLRRHGISDNFSINLFDEYLKCSTHKQVKDSLLHYCIDKIAKREIFESFGKYYYQSKKIV